jgi:hypothetical protein
MEVPEAEMNDSGTHRRSVEAWHPDGRVQPSETCAAQHNCTHSADILPCFTRRTTSVGCMAESALQSLNHGDLLIDKLGMRLEAAFLPVYAP